LWGQKKKKNLRRKVGEIGCQKRTLLGEKWEPSTGQEKDDEKEKRGEGKSCKRRVKARKRKKKAEEHKGKWAR